MSGIWPVEQFLDGTGQTPANVCGLLRDKPLDQPPVEGRNSQLDELVRSQGWIEHIVIGAPFGILARDSLGLTSWLQLEPARNLPELAEMAESQGWNPAMVEDVRAGRKLLDLELELALGAGRKPESQAAFCIACANDKVYAALFKIDASLGLGLSNSHASFITGRDRRKIEE